MASLASFRWSVGNRPANSPPLKVEEQDGIFGISQGARVRVREGLRFKDFAEGDVGVVVRIDVAASSCEVRFEGRSNSMPVAARHLELMSAEEDYNDNDILPTRLAGLSNWQTSTSKVSASVKESNSLWDAVRELHTLLGQDRTQHAMDLSSLQDRLKAQMDQMHISLQDRCDGFMEKVEPRIEAVLGRNSSSGTYEDLAQGLVEMRSRLRTIGDLQSKESEKLRALERSVAGVQQEHARSRSTLDDLDSRLSALAGMQSRALERERTRVEAMAEAVQQASEALPQDSDLPLSTREVSATDSPLMSPQCVSECRRIDLGPPASSSPELTDNQRLEELLKEAHADLRNKVDGLFSFRKEIRELGRPTATSRAVASPRSGLHISPVSTSANTLCSSGADVAQCAYDISRLQIAVEKQQETIRLNMEHGKAQMDELEVRIGTLQSRIGDITARQGSVGTLLEKCQMQDNATLGTQQEMLAIFKRDLQVDVTSKLEAQERRCLRSVSEAIAKQAASLRGELRLEMKRMEATSSPRNSVSAQPGLVDQVSPPQSSSRLVAPVIMAQALPYREELQDAKRQLSPKGQANLWLMTDGVSSGISAPAGALRSAIGCVGSPPSVGQACGGSIDRGNDAIGPRGDSAFCFVGGCSSSVEGPTPSQVSGASLPSPISDRGIAEVTQSQETPTAAADHKLQWHQQCLGGVGGRGNLSPRRGALGMMEPQAATPPASPRVGCCNLQALGQNYLVGGPYSASVGNMCGKASKSTFGGRLSSPDLLRVKAAISSPASPGMGSTARLAVGCTGAGSNIGSVSSMSFRAGGGASNIASSRSLSPSLARLKADGGDRVMKNVIEAGLPLGAQMWKDPFVVAPSRRPALDRSPTRRSSSPGLTMLREASDVNLTKGSIEASVPRLQQPNLMALPPPQRLGGSPAASPGVGIGLTNSRSCLGGSSFGGGGFTGAVAWG